MTEPILTTGPGEEDIDRAIVVNGRIDLHKTHPNLYLMVTSLGIVSLLLAANFMWLKPTFEVYHLSNWVWGATFLALGVGKLFFLNVFRSLRGVRIMLACCVSYTVFFAVGTCEPWLDGEGSLQLPILYLAMAGIQIPMLLEPFLNPWTATRGNGSWEGS